MRRLITLSTCFLFSCISVYAQSFSKEPIPSFNILDVVGKRKEMLLSQIAKKIEYVRLETSKDVILGSNNIQAITIGDFIFISQSDRPLCIFDTSGKFLRNIGQIGKGPGEYNKGYSSSIDQNGKRVFILNSLTGSILVYDWEGKFLTKIDAEKPLIEFEYIGNNLLCGCLRTKGLLSTNNYNYVVFDITGKTIKGIYIPGAAFRTYYAKIDGQTKPMGMQLTPIFASSPSGVNIGTCQNDSIFTVTPDGILSPSLSWNFGKYKAPFFFMDPTIENKVKEKYVSPLMTVETEKYWFISFSLQNKFYKAYIDKKTNQYYELEDNKNAIRNDIDGGPNFWPFYDSFKGKVFATPLSPISLKKELEAGKYDQANILFPNKNRELKDLINSLDVNDNQIIRIIELL